MNIKMTIKLVAFGVLIVTVAHWLRDHDILTGVALLFLFVVALAKVVIAIKSRPGSEPPSIGGGGGRRPPDAPVPRPSDGRPPTLGASAEARQ
jgi:hypothetical protein